MGKASGPSYREIANEAVPAFSELGQGHERRDINKNFKLCQGMIELDIRKRFSPERGVRGWNGLPGAVVESPVWEVSKESLGMMLSALCWSCHDGNGSPKPIDSMIL